jgi:hypothetical protein
MVATLLLALAAAAPATDADAPAEDESPSWLGAEVEVDSRFVWRGIALSSGPVAQPSLWLSSAGLTAAIWANAALKEEGRRGRGTSMVPTLAYTAEWGAFEVEPGVMLYVASHDPRTTAEGSLEAAYALDPFRLVSETKLDVAAQPGAYFGRLGVEYERASGRWALLAGAGLGWANTRFNATYLHAARSGVDVADAILSVRYELLEPLFLAPQAELSALVVPSAQARREALILHGGVVLGLEL